MVACWLGTAGHAQTPGAPEPARAQPGDNGPAAAHPLLARVTPPAWLAGRSTLLVLGLPAADTSAQTAWSDALRAAFTQQLPAGAVELASTVDGSRDTLVTRLRTAGRDTGVSVALRRDQQRVLLTARYVDARSEPPVEHVSEASAPLDAFLTRVVGGVPPVRASTISARSLRFDAAGLLGFGVADLDGDQRDELIVARAPHVSVYTLESAGGARLRLVRRARARWPAARPTVPMVRRFEAWFSVQSGRVVLARSDREGDFALALVDGELLFEPVASGCSGGLLFSDGCARWVPGRDYFEGELVPAGAPDARADGLDDEDDVEPSEDSPSQQPRFYARVVRDVRQPSGAALPVAVLVTPRGSLVVSAAGRHGSVGGQGASLAAADVDADGVLDVLTSDYIREGQEDRLRWFRVTPDGRVALLWESPRMPGSVLHSAAGDFLGTGRPVFVAFETRARGGSRVWVVE
ncbi:MAG: hypothetical protein IPG81_04320 [Sandaracinaceae bacterium]|nr:hypothetical protein [Sandaracinaceae bacterium]